MNSSTSPIQLRPLPQSHAPAPVLGLDENGTVYDERDMQAMQEKQVFFRTLGGKAVVALNSTVVLPWQTVLVGLGFVLYNGGTGGLFFSLIFAAAGFVPTYLSIAELSSSFPTAAGQFQWVYECAPARYRRVLAFCTGWLCSFAWPTFAASCAVITGNTVRDCVLLYHPEAPIIGHAIIPGWFSTLVAWTTLLLAYLFTTKMAKWLAWVEKTVLVVHICHAVAVVVVLWSCSPIATAKDALLTFNNGGDWPGQVSFFVGSIYAYNVFIGMDCSVHMTENVRDASRVVPLALMTALATNATLALLVAITLVFTIGDVGELLATATVQPFVAIFLNTTGSKGAAIALIAPFIPCFFTAQVGEVATASRQMWSFARVGGLPFSRRLQSVTDHEYPDVAVNWTVILAGLVTLPNLFSAVGFNAIISLISVTLLLSYAITHASTIYRRIYGPELPPTRRFSLGRVGLAINIIALLFQLMAAVFSLFPSDAHPTVQSMNWGILMFVLILILGLAYWWWQGHREFEPKMRKDD